MARTDNPFLTYLSSHPGADASALKQLFRMLAMRTHPDLGAENEADFVRLQDAYNDAVAELLLRQERAGRSVADAGHPGGRHEIWLPATGRERVLHFLYRYKAHLPSMSIDPVPVPPACERAFRSALEASAGYTEECHYALEMFHQQFHTNRRDVARYPDVATKYRLLMQALASFFDYCVITNEINKRLVVSYLSEIKPVTDFDPEGRPELRSNRSAAARSAMFRMRGWLELELNAGPCRLL